ncbi:MAG: flavohemoglobin expression-modulating QEGLA motif protein [Verrucomicrobiales bacterium]
MSAREKEHERLRLACRMLREAERPVRIMRALLWPPGVRELFFLHRAHELPVVAYAEFDPRPTLDATRAVRRLARSTSIIDHWLRRLAGCIEDGARLLGALGTEDFHRHSKRIFGAPTDALPDETTTSLGLALRFNEILDRLAPLPLDKPDTTMLRSDVVADMLRDAVRDLFGERAPSVRVVRHLGSKALAGSQRIRIRKDARFSQKEAAQLIQHEAFIHIVTSLNGRGQPDLVILGAGHPGTTRTQEGLAVFAEFITAAMDLNRLRRLADRVFAIQQAIDGADFLDIYKYFLGRTQNKELAFEGAWRVFRGAPLTGGAPLTKDIVYLDGLLRVHSFLRSAVSAGRADVVRVLFAGKLDLDDLPALCQLAKMGMLRAPEFVPPWAADPGHLLSYLAFSSFLNTIDLKKIAHRNQEMLAQAPLVRFSD